VITKYANWLIIARLDPWDYLSLVKWNGGVWEVEHLELWEAGQLLGGN